MKLKTRILEYRPRLQKLYKICTNELKFPILEIRDENNKLVKFSTGFPTIVKVRISEMPRKMNHFYIRVACYDSKLIISENNCSNFDVKLPKEVQVDSNWKVSLTSIFFPKTYIIFTYRLMKLRLKRTQSQEYRKQRSYQS